MTKCDNATNSSNVLIVSGVRSPKNSNKQAFFLRKENPLPRHRITSSFARDRLSADQPQLASNKSGASLGESQTQEPLNLFDETVTKERSRPGRIAVVELLRRGESGGSRTRLGNRDGERGVGGWQDGEPMTQEIHHISDNLVGSRGTIGREGIPAKVDKRNAAIFSSMEERVATWFGGERP